jgi:hypothetical protein
MGYFVVSPEFLPYVSTIVNLIFSFTPLLSYGTTVLSIRKKKSSQGFSIDICGTMLVASILRIFYYFNDPFEITLLRQCFIMVFIQTILLHFALKYRSADAIYFEKYQSHWDKIYDKFIDLNKEKINETFEIYGINDNYDNLNIKNMFIGIIVVILECFHLNLLLIFSCILEFIKGILRLFDYHYIRPFNYWQWKEPMTFWKFLFAFIMFLTIIQLNFHGDEYLGICFGTASFMIESSLPLPQILLFQRIKNVDNFKTILLLSWLGGDVTKISYLFFGTDNVGSIFIFAAFFQMSLNFVITYQFFYYKFNPSNNLNEIQMNFIPIAHNRNSISNNQLNNKVNLYPIDEKSDNINISFNTTHNNNSNTSIPTISRAASLSLSGIITNLNNVTMIPQSQHYQHKKSLSFVNEENFENDENKHYFDDNDNDDVDVDVDVDVDDDINVAKCIDNNNIIPKRNTSIDIPNEIGKVSFEHNVIEEMRSRANTVQISPGKLRNDGDENA